MRGADALMRTLQSEGVDVIFSLSGNQIMPIFDASIETDVRLVHTRHEAAAGFMAEGHAQISGRVGVALVTAGAGLGNAISPLLTARASQTPLLLLSGDSPVAKDGQGAFQEMDQVALTASITKLSRRVTDPATIEGDVREAMEVATTGQPGPVHLSLPADVLLGEVAQLSGLRSSCETASPDTSAILQALRSAKKPLILLGPELTATRAALDFTAVGIPAIAMESPRGAKDPSLGRFGQVWEQADFVVVLGKPVDFSLRFGAGEAWPNARWITVYGDRDEVVRAERNLGPRAAMTLHAAPLLMARALIADVTADLARPGWCAEVGRLCAEQPDLSGPSTTIDSPTLCSSVQALVDAAREPIFISDGGEIGQWAQALIRAPRRIINGVSGAIGGGICYAMGAKAASPESDVIAVMGDGTAGFHLPEFETAVREALPFVAVIGNDQVWNAEHQLQLRTFGADRTLGCSLSGARYDQAVAALGGFGAHVTRPDELADALSEALRSGRPACVNVEIEGLPAPVFD